MGFHVSLGECNWATEPKVVRFRVEGLGFRALGKEMKIAFKLSCNSRNSDQTRNNNHNGTHRNRNVKKDQKENRLMKKVHGRLRCLNVQSSEPPQPQSRTRRPSGGE